MGKTMDMDMDDDWSPWPRVELRLPWPPSINHYWGRSKNGQYYIKPAGRRFRRDVLSILKIIRCPRVDTPVRAILAFTPPDCRKRDPDNLEKAIWDALSDNPSGGRRGVISGDSGLHIPEKHVFWTKPQNPGFVTVELETILKTI